MGCDIHMYREKHIDGRWLAADNWQADSEDGGAHVPYKQRAYEGRNYELFGLLAGVRKQSERSIEPRGLPLDVTPEVAADSERWGDDGHSRSHIYLGEVRALRDKLATETIRIEGMKDREELAALRATIAAGTPDWSLLFPYCGWGSSPELEKFALDVPASFYVGNSLNQIIASFDGIDGDNHRFVFWFDS